MERSGPQQWKNLKAQTMKQNWKLSFRLAGTCKGMLLAGVLICWGLASKAESAGTNQVVVRDGVVLPQRPVAEAIADAMQFLKKADGGYVPGKIDGELAGYFTSAFVNPDGTRSDRLLSFPARQHAYFIFTFLRYYAYTGEPEWRLRARDLADWNMNHSTPPAAAYPNVPYSTFSDGKPGGSKDVDSIEPDKAAFIGSAYVAVYEATGEKKYLTAAKSIADTLVRHQNEDGSWPFRVIPETGAVRQEFGGAPVFFVEFFENILRYDNPPEYRRAQDRALKLLLQRNAKKNLWGTYHEDILLKPETYLSAEPMSFTADYLFRHGKAHPEYIEPGRQILRHMEARLVHTDGHAAAPAPAVSEQAGFDHIMPGHTARYCLALADLYRVTGDESVKKQALSGINALTYMQSPAGLFRTFFFSVNEKARGKPRPDWYSQHLYTVCHVLELMPALPQVVPDGQDHLLGSSVFVRAIHFQPGAVSFETIAPARTVLKLSFVPKAVHAGKRTLPKLKEINERNGWAFDPATRLLTIRHDAGPIKVE